MIKETTLGIDSDLFPGRVLARNTIVNVFGQGLPILSAIFAIPILIERLHTDRFGVLTLAWMFIGYFNLFDLGLSRALTKEIASRLGKKDEFNTIKSYVYTTLIFTFLLGGLGSLVMLVSSKWITHDLLNIPPHLEQEAFDAMIIIALAIPFVVTSTACRGVLEAYQQFQKINLVHVPLGLFSYVGPLVVSIYDTSLGAVVGVLVVGRLLGWMALMVLSFSALPPGGSRQFDFTILRRLFTYGGWITVSNVVSPLINYVDRFLVGSLISITAVAYYATPIEMILKVWIIPGAFMSVIFPAFAFSFENEPQNAAKLFNRSYKLIIGVLFPLSLFLVIFSHEILSTWINPDFAASSSQVLKWLGVAILINCTGFVPMAFLQAAGRPDLPAKFHLLELPVFIVALFSLTLTFGLTGAAMAWFFRTALDVTLLFFASSRFLSPHFKVNRNRLIFLIALAVPLYMVGFLNIQLETRLWIFCGFIFIYPWFIWFIFASQEENRILLSWLWDIVHPTPKSTEKMKPIRKIGIAMAAYKPKPEYFAIQLKSIQEQSFRDWICVITFDSPIKEYQENPALRMFFEDPRFEWHENTERLGFKKNFEKALHLVSSKEVQAVAFSDQDDYWFSNKLEVCARELEKCIPMSLVHSDMEYIDGRGRVIWPSVWAFERRVVEDQKLFHFLLRNTVTGASCLFDADIARKFPVIPDCIMYHDHWYGLLASYYGVVKPIPQALFGYRQHGNNVVGVVPFEGLFTIPPGLSWRELLEKAYRGFRVSHDLLKTLESQDLQSPRLLRWMFASRYERGFTLLLVAILTLKIDPPLSRALFAKGLGKARG